MSKINPGSNFNEDNDVQTARPGGLQDTDIIEPVIGDDGKLHCPLCSGIFKSREAYISHALSKHHTMEQAEESMEKDTGTMEMGKENMEQGKESMEKGTESMEMSKENMKQNKDDARAYLAPVPYDVGFHFFTEVGRYTGETAISLATFARDVEVAPIESINFHFGRADFQKWIAETIGDTELAAAIEKVEKNLAGEPLRLRLLEIINAHVKGLESQV
ncbi:MAG TPA: hypothetical protein VLV84_00110 [Candidatus Acidoferrales bacterium]|nr:hypothetical protein [Candidatus Acidoferrales bacterium]